MNVYLPSVKVTTSLSTLTTKSLYPCSRDASITTETPSFAFDTSIPFTLIVRLTPSTLVYEILCSGVSGVSPPSSV